MSLPLFDQQPDTPKAPRQPRQSFDDFHAANPHVWVRLVSLAEEYAAMRRPFGVKALVERMRWDASLRTNGRPFKIDNSLTAQYARKLYETRPDLRQWFRVRL